MKIRSFITAAALAVTSLGIMAAPASAHDAVLKAECDGGSVAWNINPDFPQQGPVKVTSISGVVVTGLAVGDVVPDSGKSFSSAAGGTLTVGLKWVGDNFTRTETKTFNGPCVPPVEKKHTICHWANGNSHAISINENALDTHLVWHEASGWNPTPGHLNDVYLHAGAELDGDDAICDPPVTTTTTTQPPVVTTTTQPPVVTTTTQPPVVVVPEPPVVVSPVVVVPETPVAAPVVPEAPSVPVAQTELPRTGAGTVILVLIALAAIAGGLVLRFLGRRNA